VLDEKYNITLRGYIHGKYNIYANIRTMKDINIKLTAIQGLTKMEIIIAA
jgi:hypothetical protein